MIPAFQKEFYGDETRWFIGEVRSVSDPLELGRVQVRVHGLYDPEAVEEAHLPWAQTAVPVTQGGTNGLGNNVGLQVGARVFGIFLDGCNSQMPLVIGSLPKFEGDGVSTNDLARGTNTLSKSVNSEVGAPADPYAAQYPSNNVYQTKSGHTIEIDDTSGAERIHIHHKSGSFIEIHPNGQIVIKGQETYIDAGSKLNIRADSFDIQAGSGDIVVDGISLVNHTHRDNPGLAGAVTTPPLK